MLCSCRQVSNLLRTNLFLRTKQQQLSRVLSSTLSRSATGGGFLCNDQASHNRRQYSSTAHDQHEDEQTISTSTVSTAELEKFKTLAPEWWKNDGEYIALRSLNKLRVSLIKELMCGPDTTSTSHPLRGVNILDVGCGGGILAEPLARLGANVTGIDPLQENIDAAIAHRGEHPDLSSLSYICTTVEDYCREHGESYDVVVASEVLEHVDNADVFVQDCCACVKGGGKFVVTTINKNLLSTVLVKYAAEYLFRIVPAGTHDEDKFVSPDELVDMLRTGGGGGGGGGMVGVNFKGMIMNPLTYKWSWSPYTAMNYACYSTKPTS